MASPAVFLDRDGTINVEVDYLRSPEQLELIPGARGALRALQEAGYVLIVVTNQSGIARGYFDREALTEIHAALKRVLAEGGVELSAIEYCPHHPGSDDESLARECDCRKPKPGMLLRAAARLDIDLGRSWMIGDAERDLQAGLAAGVRPILVQTGKGAAAHKSIQDSGGDPGLVVADLAAAAKLILATEAG